MSEQKRIDVGVVFQPRRKLSCGDVPSSSGCTVTITGTEDEVVQLAALHAADAHGHEDTPELRERIRSMLRSESI